MNSKRIIFSTLLAVTIMTPFSSAETTTRPTTQRSNARGVFHSFNLRPVAEATPPLKYRLTCDPADPLPGNAALDYFKAITLLPADAETMIDRVLDHYSMGSVDADHWLATDSAVADFMTRAKPAIEQLVLASRRLSCEWGDTNAPAPNELVARLGHVRQLAQLLRVRALFDADMQRTADAIPIVGADYAIAANVARDQPLVCGLVGISIEALTHDTVSELQDRSDAVNLYWPLRDLPSPLIDLKRVWAGEQRWGFGKVPASQVEPFRFFDDEVEKALSLPLLDAATAIHRLPAKLQINRGTLAMSMVPSLEHTVRTFIMVERTRAALTVVEAIRSYAAANHGQVPPSLEAITDTPAPLNPADGKPFNYRVDGNVATLSDRTTETGRDLPLEYTITIRK